VPSQDITPSTAWVDQLEDERLREVVRRALAARGAAVQAGAERYGHCATVLRSGDRALASVAKRPVGAAAFHRAGLALKRYDRAADCAERRASKSRPAVENIS